MNVLLLNGSPHENGCTSAALEEIAAALNRQGIETERMWIGKETIQGCSACGSCRNGKTQGRCIFDGDLVNAFLEKMEKSDGLVIGSPVYYASPNGSLLAMLDRAFYAGNCFRWKPACAVVSARRAGTTAAYDVLNKYLTISGMLLTPTCYWNMVHGNRREEALQDEEGMRIMRVLGNNMAWQLRTLEAARDTVALPAEEPPARTNFIR